MRNTTSICCLIALFVSLTVASSANNVTFAYQGRVKVQGQPFNGTGQFKLSIVNTSGSLTLWSHDGTGQNGNEPTGTALSVPVADGLFTIQVGDTGNGQQPISPTIFADKQPLKLRVWFDGGAGFQQLLPDQNLSDLTLSVQETGADDFTIYVNAITGNDTHNGLTPITAKKTIQAAVNAIPERLHCNVTIDIANATYPEQVDLHGFNIDSGKQLLLLGDETWTSVSAQTPSVIISGAEGGTNYARNYAVIANQCSGVTFRGLHFKAAKCGMQLVNGTYSVISCLASNNGSVAGICASKQSDVSFRDCLSSNNQGPGFLISTSSVHLYGIGARSNGSDGFFAQFNCQVNLWNHADLSNNGGAGIEVWASHFGFGSPVYMTISGNAEGCLVLHYMSQVTFWTNNYSAGRFTTGGSSPSINTGSQIWN